jgi:hypothetical protein
VCSNENHVKTKRRLLKHQFSIHWVELFASYQMFLFLIAFEAQPVTSYVAQNATGVTT